MRLLIPPDDIRKKQGILLSAERSHYLLNVLRAGRGDCFTAIDGQGRAYPAEISDIVRPAPMKASAPGGSALRALIDITGEPSGDDEGPASLVLCQGLLKGDKMDLVVQKVTELGVSEIQPLVTERSIVRQTRKAPRWRRIAEEAAEQCGRATVPAIRDPLHLSAFLNARGPLAGIVLWEEGGQPLSDALAQLNASELSAHAASSDDRPPPSCARLVLIVGPEGGLSVSEVMEAQSQGLLPVSLGSRTLRSETAAIVGVALTNFLLEYGRP